MAELLNTQNVVSFGDQVSDGLDRFYNEMEERITDQLDGKFVEYVGFENRPGPTKWFLIQETFREVECNRNGTISINGREVLDGLVEVG